MKVLVLGPAAGPVEPDPNAGAPCSMAVSADGEAWVLVNASPELGAQRRRAARAQGLSGPTGLPIRAVVLTDARLEHVAGLLSLHDGPRLELFATPGVYEELTTSLPLVNVLQSYCGVRWHMLPVAGDQRAAEFQIDAITGLRFTAVAVPGRAPAHSERRHEDVTGDSIALIVDDLRHGTRLYCGPAPDRLDDDARAWLRSADTQVIEGRFVDTGDSRRRSLDERGIECTLDTAEARS